MKILKEIPLQRLMGASSEIIQKGAFTIASDQAFRRNQAPEKKLFPVLNDLYHDFGLGGKYQQAQVFLAILNEVAVRSIIDFSITRLLDVIIPKEYSGIIDWYYIDPLDREQIAVELMDTADPDLIEAINVGIERLGYTFKNKPQQINGNKCLIYSQT